MNIVLGYRVLACSDLDTLEWVDDETMIYTTWPDWPPLQAVVASWDCFIGVIPFRSGGEG